VNRVSQPAVKTHTRPRGYISAYRPQLKTRELLSLAVAVLNEYREYWPLTVRQIFYRLVGAYAQPKTESFYARVCEHVANARRAQVIPFAAIRDDGVSVWQGEYYRDIDHFYARVRSLGESYSRDRLARQPVHIEVWCEAAGIVPQLARVASAYSIPVYSSSGFDSLTAKKNLADRIAAISKSTVVLHLGDCDPSGEAIFASVAADVRAFVEADRLDARVSVDFRRVALTREQVLEHGLLSAPAKASDTRSRSWRGETCQLEALPPNVLAELLRGEIEGLVDQQQLESDLKAEERERRRIAYSLAMPVSDEEAES
jgi:hypothetical protein